MRITRDLTITLTIDEELQVLRKYAGGDKTSKKIYDIIKTTPKGDCPFTRDCKEFPCATLSCNADSCSNGYTSRQS